MQRKFVQTMEQVLPETSFGYRLLQVLIGSGYQTDVRLNLLLTAYGAVTFSCKARNSALCTSAFRLPTSSKNSVPWLAAANMPVLIFRRSGKGTLHMTEQFRCRQFLRKHPAIHCDERCIRPTAQHMYLPGHIFLACP